MKILWITEFFPASEKGEITGGVEARCFFVKKHLEKLGHKVKVVAEFTTGKRWTHIALSSLFKQLVFLLRVSRKAFQELATDYDVVEGANYPTYYLAWIIGTLKRKPIVFWYPDVFIGSWVKNVGLAGLVGELSERLTLKLPVDRYVAISQATKNKLIKAGVPAAKIDIVYCGADSDEVSLASRQKNSKVFDVCVVSRLVNYKRVEDFIRAVAILKNKLPNIKTAIVGQGPEKNKLASLAKSLQVSTNIELVGYLPTHTEVLGVMAKSKILCLSSSAEGFGICVIEAASLGLPTVVSNIPVLSEITNGGATGSLYELGNPKDLAEKLLTLLTDKKLYFGKSVAAKEIGKKYTWRKAASQTEKIYEDLLSH